MRKEIEVHPYREDPIFLLHDYDIRPLLDTRREGTTEVKVWREFETIIQYGEWSCRVTFNFRYTENKTYEIHDVRLFPYAKAPEPHQQYEI